MSFLINPWKFNLLFLQYPWKSHISPSNKAREYTLSKKHWKQCSTVVVKTGRNFSNVLQANTKIIQNYLLAILQTEKLHCNLLQAKSRYSLETTEMINLGENNRNLPKPSLAHHHVPEPPSERVSVDVNTLLSKSNYLSLRTTYPTGRFYKNGWLNKHNRHVALLKAKRNSSPQLLS